jgi:hypothetical protein
MGSKVSIVDFFEKVIGSGILDINLPFSINHDSVKLINQTG